MAAVRVVQVAGDEVVRVIAVRHGFVAAAGAVRVAGGVRGAGMARRAGFGIRGRDRQAMLVRVPAVDVVEVPVVEVIRVAVVREGGVTTARAVRVGFGVLPVRRATGGNERADGEGRAGDSDEGGADEFVHARK